MYTNCRSSSLLEWKYITDQEADDYLLQSFLRKTEWEEMRNSGNKPSHAQLNRTGASHTTKATQYIEEGKTRRSAERAPMEHNKTTDMAQHGKDSHDDYNQGGRKQTRTETLRPSKFRITQEEAKVRLTERGRKLQEKLTREAILDMMESGHLTIEESEIELKRLELRNKENSSHKRNKSNTPRLSHPGARQTRKG